MSILFHFINHPGTLCFVQIVSLAIKFYIISVIIKSGWHSKIARKPWLSLIIILAGAITESMAWCLKSISMLQPCWIDYRYVLLVIRISLACFVIQYQALSLFLSNLTEKNFRLNIVHKFLLGITGLVATYLLGLAVVDSGPVTREMRKLFMDTDPLEAKVIRYLYIYIYILVLPAIAQAVGRLRAKTIPKILSKQLRIFLVGLITPFLALELIQSVPAVFLLFEHYYYAITALSTSLLTYALYYCTSRVMRLRFLNLQSHVKSPASGFNFIDDFKLVLEQLSMATTMNELTHITQTFFKEAFSIPLSKISLHVRSQQAASDCNFHHPTDTNIVEVATENFLSTRDVYSQAHTILQAQHILITDEIEFSNFYDEQPGRKTLLEFLNGIGSDIFIPIYERDRISAYIIIECNSRVNNFFTDVERDEMLVFAQYLGNVINLLQSRNLQALLEHDKKMHEELHHKKREISQYRESVHSFLYSPQERKIGIMFYKNRHFILGNQEAQELVSININTLIGHPLTKALRAVATHVDHYKRPFSMVTRDTHGKSIVVAGLPHLDEHSTIMALWRPEIADVIQKQIPHLRDASDWDYLLHLERTRSGQMINRFIPGGGRQLIDFKIKLLKVAIGARPVVLTMPEPDLLETIEIIHRISERENLQRLSLKEPRNSDATAIQLFGINPLFSEQQHGSGLLAQLDPKGTLFIKNIHFLDYETQEYLAEYLRYGFYRIFKSDQKVKSDVHVICSTDQDLQELVQDGKFSETLYHELKDTRLSFPSLQSLSTDEFQKLVDGCTEQALQECELKTFLELTDREKNRLDQKRPANLHELRARIERALKNKSRSGKIGHTVQFEPAFGVTDPELIAAARLGKRALRDGRIMALLWKKFKNQNKIATFLGVNRSSVNRRCKEYNFE